MKRNVFILSALVMLGGLTLKAQESFKDRLQVNGFIQTEFEYTQWEGKSNNGKYQTYTDGIDNADKDYFLRYGVRRGGIRMAYIQGKIQGIFELDLNNGDIYPKAATINYRPWDFMEINAGLQTVWFGEEVPYSTPKQETLEHCEILRKLFPLDRDLGLKISLYAPKESAFNGLKLDVGLVTGDGINLSSDGRLNFVGHLKYNNRINDIQFGIGTSLYAGTVSHVGTKTYTYGEAGASYSVTKNVNKTLNRTYYGLDAQVKIPTSLGTTEIKGEYIFGNQVSQANSFSSPNGNEYTTGVFDTQRKFYGGYAYLFQDLGKLPLRVLLKYTHITPDKDIKQKDLPEGELVAYNTFGIGCQWKIFKGLQLTALFDVNSNLSYNKENILTADPYKYSYDRKDNHFTLRLQYEF